MIRNNWTDGEAFAHTDQNDVANEVNGKVDKATLTAKGDLYVATNSGTVTNLPVGTNNQVLMADSGQTTGVKWGTVSNGTFSDTAFTLQDNTDATKQLTFELSGLTTGTTRTLSVPDASTTLVGTDTTQTLTGKSLSGSTNTFSAIPQSAVTSLSTDLSGKEPTITAGTTGQYWRGDKSFQDLNKSAVGLANVDNTSDADKPISTATSTALSGKEPTIIAGASGQYYRGDKTFADLNKTAVGLSNVDNTSDANKPISTATQTALDAKEPTITAGTSGQYWRGDKAFADLNKSAVGLGNVDNTSDANKPVSTATSTALDGKEPTITSGTTAQYWRGDKSFQTLDKTAVGLSNVDNTSDANKPISTATQTALDGKQAVSEKGQANGYATLDTNGKVPGSQLPNSIMTYEGLHDVSANSPTLSDVTGDAGQVYRVSVGGTRNYGSGNLVLNVGDYLIHNGSVWQFADTTDAVSTVNGYTGNITLTKSDVGLSNVDNTSDADKPISTATSTALSGKAATNQTMNIGTTAVTIDRASGNLGLTGISSIALPGATSGTVTLTPAATAGTTALTLPASTGTVVSTGDTGTVTSTMIADGTITNDDISASAAIAASKLDSTVLTTTGSQAISNKTSIASTGTITGSQLTSTVATGTAPLTVSSTTAVTNLNADLLDGNHASAFVASNGALGTPSSGTLTNCVGQVADLSIVTFGASTTRATGTGDFPFGVKLQRAVTFTSVTYRVATADASGNLVAELRKNGVAVSGSSATIAAASQVGGGTATGSWAFAEGDIITVQITAIGTTPGKGLVADVKGLTA